MKPTGGNRSQVRSGERSGSYQRRASPVGPNTYNSKSKLPTNYKPPHMRNNFVGGTNRVSPGAPRIGQQRPSPNTRVSPGTRQYGYNNRVSPNTRPGGGISNLGGQANL